MTDAIGGYFGLELRRGEHYHHSALKLNTARNCFEYILRARQYDKVYMPCYTCEVMFQPLDRLGVSYELYHVNEDLEITVLPELKASEAILYTNYFALKHDYAQKLASIYGDRLIIDNAQAFYAPRIEGTDTFYSARKFFGVPDGAYLYTDCILDEELEQDVSLERTAHLLKRIESGAESGYPDFRKADDSLDNQPIKRMSLLTEAILMSIDYQEARRCRCENFKYLESHLALTNQLNCHADEDAVPMCYPYLSSDPDQRGRLIENRIYVPRYWPNEFNDNTGTEQRLQEMLLPLPVDQRLEESDLVKILNCLK